MQFGRLGAAVLAIGLIAGCGSNKVTVQVTVAPSSATVVLGGTQLFTASVTGTPTTTVTWQLCTGAPNANPTPTCGSPTLGTVNTNGYFTAPTTLPDPPTATIVATSTSKTDIYGYATINLTTGISVKVIPATYLCTNNAAPTSGSIQAGGTIALTACVTGSQNQSVIWAVDNVVGGNVTDGTITAGGVYSAPITSPSSVTISATSQQDQTVSGSFALTIGTTAVPSLTLIDPMNASQGSLFQDVYLTGSNFFLSSVALVNGSAADVTTTYLSASSLRARIGAPLLQSPGTLELSVEGDCDAQGNNCSFSPSLPLIVSPVRPGLISETPVNIPQGSSGTATIGLTGGFYSPSTTATFNGQSVPASIPTNNANDPYSPDPRLLDTVLSSTDFSTAGLFPLVLNNPGVTDGTSSITSINVAVTPTTAPPSAAQATVGVGAGPTAIAINTVTDTAVVANTGAASISIFSLAGVSNATTPVTVAVGNTPTGVAVDNLLNEAIVVNSADNTFTVVNLTNDTAGPAIALPATYVPYSVGVNSLTHRALIANQETNVATVVDLATTPPTIYPQIGGTTNPISTGNVPQVAIVPQLNWAIVTPGGAGTVSIVDLGSAASQGNGGRAPAVVATLTLTTTVQGVSFNTETNQAILSDPDGTSLIVFNVLDNSTFAIAFAKNGVATTTSPLTNVAVAINNNAGLASTYDLGTSQLLGTTTLGTNPQAAAIDPTTDTVVVANQGSNNVSIFSLAPVRQLEVTDISPAITFSSASPETLTVIGNGFASGAVVRLDQVAVATSSVPSSCNAGVCRELQATIPANLLNLAHRFIVDVQNPTADSTGSAVSNTRGFTVIQPVEVGTSPAAVAVDTDRDLAIVTNSGSNTVSVVNLTNGTAASPIAVGADPIGVAVLPRLALAVVANNGDNTFTVINDLDLAAVSPSPIANCSVCLGPTAVAINPDTATAFATDYDSNAVSFFSIAGLPSGNAPTVSSITVDQQPLAVAVDFVDNIAAVTAAPPPQDSATNTVDIINLATDAIVTRLTGFEDPSGAVYDPASSQFLVTDSLNNNVVYIDPLTYIQTRVRVGIDPSAIANNFQTSTYLTLDAASNTISVVDAIHQKVQLMLPIQGAAQYSMDVDAKLGLVVVVDQLNNRVLLVPIPR
jgi:DNA-binding beta-propeller fold protein YncE